MSASLRFALPAREAIWDASLPGLAQALDAAVMKQLMVDRGLIAPGGHLAVRYVRYQPGRSAHIVYEDTNGNGTALFYGALTAPGVELLAGHERDAKLDGGGKQHVFVAEVPMVIRPFPHDPVLRRLPEVWSLRPFAHRLHSLLEDEEPQAWKLTGWDISIVRYKPERRCVFRLHLRTRERNGGRKRRLRVFGQVDGDGTGSRVSPVVAALASREGVYGPLAVARPVLVDPMLRLMISETIAGTPLPLHLSGQDAKKIVRRLAGRLADIHRSGVEPPAQLTHADRQRALADAVAVLAAVDQARGRGLASRAAALCDRLGANPPDGKRITNGCLHGDFHPGQVLVRGRLTWIIDFDRTATGDPLHDLAAFTSALLMDASENRMASHTAQRAAKIFLRSYIAAWPEVWDPVRYAWHVSAALLEATVAPLRQLQTGWATLVEERLRLAEAAEAAAAADAGLRDGWVIP